jgi:hypothetical protein
MATPAETLVKAIDANDLDAVKACIRAAPDVLESLLTWQGGQGYALSYAARENRPEIIEYLVIDCGQDINRKNGVTNGWSPLRYAQFRTSLEAARMLLALGADPSVTGEDGKDTREFCEREDVRTAADPRYEEKRRRRQQEARENKAAGTWTRTGPREVVHDREFADVKCRVTDIFNFETRSWLTVSRDLSGSGMSQSQVFFDALPDDEALRPAFDKLKELGGEARDEDLGSRRLLKTAKPGLGGA